MLFLSLFLGVEAQVREELFVNPPQEARPGTYWMMMNGNISKEGITRDLEYMSRNHYGSAIMLHVGVGIPKGNIEYGSDAWLKMTRHALSEAKRVGMTLMMHNSPGYSGTGGSWITPELSMQELKWSDTYVRSNGMSEMDIPLPQPHRKMGWYKDACVLAYPSSEGETKRFDEVVKRITLDGKPIDKALVLGGNPSTKVRFERSATPMVIELTEPFEAHSISILRHPELPLDPHDGPRDYPTRWTLESSDDGVHYRSVTTFSTAALRALDAPGVASFPKVKARYFRLTNAAPNWLANIDLLPSPRLADWPIKANFISSSLPFAQPQSSSLPGIDPDRVVDLTSLMDSNGRLRWKAPAGRWTIVRMGHTTTGEEQAAAPTGVHGLECDKFRTVGVDAHFDRFIDPLMNDLSPHVGTTLTGLMIDSWEVGRQNWCEGFPQLFRQMRRYDPTPYWLAMTGRVVADEEQSERFLFDVRRTQADLFNQNYLQRFKERSSRHGLLMAGEAYGDGNFESLEYAERCDLPMCEFWTHYIYGTPAYTRMAASVADIFGKKKVSAECFTGTPFNSKFTEHPYGMKAQGDWMMTEGVNHFTYHVNAHQPYTAEAGVIMTMGPFGSHLNRNSTWADLSAPYNLYNSRCAYLLQQGVSVSDLLYFKEESISSNVKNYDIEEPCCPKGYKWSVVGASGLKNRVAVRNGIITLPDGKTYSLFVLPSCAKITSETLRVILSLVKQGMSILYYDLPQSTPNLDQEQARQVETMLEELKQLSSAKPRGKVFCNQSIASVLKELAVAPDFNFHASGKDAQIHFVHRQSSPNEHLYFVANHRRREEPDLLLSFRLGEEFEPELWNPLTGTTALPVAFTHSKGRTLVRLSLDECGSMFLLFRPKKEKAPSSPSHRPLFLPRTFPDDEPIVWQQTFTLATWVKPETFAVASRGFLLPPSLPTVEQGEDAANVNLSVGVNGVRVFERSRRQNQLVLDYQEGLSGWTHLAVVYHAGTPQLFLNGTLVKEGKNSGMRVSLNTEPTTVYDHFSIGFEGDQTPLQGFSEAFSSEEIAKLYRVELPAPPLKKDEIALLQLNNDWTVCFPSASQAPDSITLSVLRSLHLHDDFNVKHFSGTAVYRKAFLLSNDELHRPLVLDLGRVENIAQVILNGHPVDTLWKAPYRTDISRLVRKGENRLELRITNLYPNRMIGDQHLPSPYSYDQWGRIKKLPAWYSDNRPRSDRRILFSTWLHYTKKEPLFEAGLIGPVRLVGVEREKQSDHFAQRNKENVENGKYHLMKDP